ncbi:MAG: mechanosensitive ion channel domain-containing protein, partial [Planctomycetia bacterium]
RQVCRPLGLADAHFNFRPTSLQSLRRTLRCLIFAGLPIVFLVVLFEHWDPENHRAVARLTLVAAQLLLSIVLAYTFHPRSPLLYEFLATDKTSWSYRFRYVWYVVAVAGPAALAGVALFGYTYTSLELTRRLQASVWLCLGLGLVHLFLLRWLLLARRRIALQRARDRRAALQANSEASTTGGVAPTPPENPCDLNAVSGQTRQLIVTSLASAALLGIWLTWIDVTPALGVLDRVPLWTTSSTSTESIQQPDGSVKIQTNDDVVPVTLNDLLFAVGVLALMVLAVKNVPGCLEIAVLPHLPLDAGGRYAVATLSRYAITIVGVIGACAVVGLKWSSVQWMAAAVTVGLGFGLQEIFANFVSGLIIFFERPIRVGDTVTVGDVSGVVSRIHIRATTITDWYNKELIVPNKEFITSKVVNWTLTDRSVRLVFNIGVAYGSDVAEVKKLLEQAARENPSIAAEPPPAAVFDGYGDSTLNFILRASVVNIDTMTPTRHELNARINELFQAASIEFAFPQRELHIHMTRADGVEVTPSFVTAEKKPAVDAESRLRSA